MNAVSTDDRRIADADYNGLPTIPEWRNDTLLSHQAFSQAQDDH